MSSFDDISKYFNGRFPKVDGNVSTKLLPANFNVNKADIIPIEDGILPDISLVSAAKYLNNDRVPREDGRVP